MADSDLDALTNQLENLALERLNNNKNDGGGQTSSRLGNGGRVLEQEEYTALQNLLGYIVSLPTVTPETAPAAPDVMEWLMSVRRMLSRVDGPPPIAEVLELDGVSTLMLVAAATLADHCSGAATVLESLKEHLGSLPDYVAAQTSEWRLQAGFEALWSLNNMASGYQQATQAVVEAGALVVALSLARESQVVQLLEIACFLVGNIAGDSRDARDYILGEGAADAVSSALDRCGSDLGVLRNAAWCLSNLLRFKPMPEFEPHAKKVLTLAQSILMQNQDPEVVGDSLWCFAYTVEAPYADVVITEVIHSGMVEGLVALVREGLPMSRAAALRIIGNIAASNDENTQIVVDAGALHVVIEGLRMRRFGRLASEALWFLSNIGAGSPEQIDLLINSGGLDVAVAWLDPISPVHHEAKEALWTITNCILGSSPQTMKTTFRNEVFVNCLLTYLATYGPRQPKPAVAVSEALERLVTDETGLDLWTDAAPTVYEALSDFSATNAVPEEYVTALQAIGNVCEIINGSMAVNS